MKHQASSKSRVIGGGAAGGGKGGPRWPRLIPGGSGGARLSVASNSVPSVAAQHVCKGNIFHYSLTIPASRHLNMELRGNASFAKGCPPAVRKMS